MLFAASVKPHASGEKPNTLMYTNPEESRKQNSVQYVEMSIAVHARNRWFLSTEMVALLADTFPFLGKLSGRDST